MSKKPTPVAGGKGPTACCHKLVRTTAQAFAAELYEVVMGNNAVRAEWRRQNPECTEKQLLSRFVERNWGRLIPASRATLAAMLNGPLPPARKEEIYEALLADNSLGRDAAPPPGSAAVH